MEMVGPEMAEQNQGDHSQGIGMCGGDLDNAQDYNGRRAGTVGAQRIGAHNPAWVGGEGFQEVVMFQLSLEGENQISVIIKMWKKCWLYSLPISLSCPTPSALSLFFRHLPIVLWTD